MFGASLPAIQECIDVWAMLDVRGTINVSDVSYARVGIGAFLLYGSSNTVHNIFVVPDKGEACVPHVHHNPGCVLDGKGGGGSNITYKLVALTI